MSALFSSGSWPRSPTMAGSTPTARSTRPTRSGGAWSEEAFDWWIGHVRHALDSAWSPV